MKRSLLALSLSFVCALACAHRLEAAGEQYRNAIESAARQVGRDLGLDLPQFDSISPRSPAELRSVHLLYLQTEGVPDPSSVWAVDITFQQRPDRLIVGGGITVFFRHPSTIPFLVWRHE